MKCFQDTSNDLLGFDHCWTHPIWFNRSTDGAWGLSSDDPWATWWRGRWANMWTLFRFNDTPQWFVGFCSWLKLLHIESTCQLAVPEDCVVMTPEEDCIGTAGWNAKTNHIYIYIFILILILWYTQCLIKIVLDCAIPERVNLNIPNAVKIENIPILFSWRNGICTTLQWPMVPGLQGPVEATPVASHRDDGRKTRWRKGEQLCFILLCFCLCILSCSFFRFTLFVFDYILSYLIVWSIFQTGNLPQIFECCDHWESLVNP